MPAGDSLSAQERQRVERARQLAETISGLAFSVYVGPSEEDSRAYAERLHRALIDPDHSVLIMCDPGFHVLEIVTGADVRRRIDDLATGLAAATMQSSFIAGDIVGGLVHGVHQLGEGARQPRTLHGRD